MGVEDVRQHMLRLCRTIGTLTSCVWVRLAVRWAAGCSSRHVHCTLVKVSWSTLGSQQTLLIHAQVCGAFALLFGLWPAGRWMGERFGPCRILGNLCGLWICGEYTTVCDQDFHNRVCRQDRPCNGWLGGRLPSGAWTRSTVRWMAGWPSAKQRLD